MDTRVQDLLDKQAIMELCWQYSRTCDRLAVC